MAEEKQGTAAVKGGVRIWTEEEKDLVWEQVVKAKAENLPLTEAFRRSAKILPHRSEAAIGMLYYNVLRKERKEPPLHPKAPSRTPEFKVDPRLLEAFQGLPEYMQDLNARLNSLEERLENPDPKVILKALGQLTEDFTSAQEQSQELEELRRENSALKEENEQLKKDLAKLKDAYDDALSIYDMFTNMASISQIMSLGDFKQQMKTTLDKWGNVLEITFARTT